MVLNGDGFLIEIQSIGAERLTEGAARARSWGNCLGSGRRDQRKEMGASGPAPGIGGYRVGMCRSPPQRLCSAPLALGLDGGKNLQQKPPEVAVSSV